MKQTVKVVVIDDHPLMAQATKQLLEQIENVIVVSIANDGASGFEQVKQHQPDLVFLDYHLPDDLGTTIAERIKGQFPHVHVVIFTGIDISDLMNRFLEIKISGIISKETSEASIKHMIPIIMDNHIVLPQVLFNKIKLSSIRPSQEVSLTDEEILMMTMVVKGSTQEQIADHIHASKRSVDNYLRKIYEKYSVKTRIQAVEQFLQSKYYADLNRGE
ncbi:MAG: Two-component response regulator ComA [Bacilli bacterium]|jgi:two-component system competent response regulator ComA|nr:Two-component response regulator ComA [Bacilli bacterium]